MWKRKHKGEGHPVQGRAWGRAGKRGRKQSKDKELQMILILTVGKMEGSFHGWNQVHLGCEGQGQTVKWLVFLKQDVPINCSWFLPESDNYWVARQKKMNSTFWKTAPNAQLPNRKPAKRTVWILEKQLKIQSTLGAKRVVQRIQECGEELFNGAHGGRKRARPCFSMQICCVTDSKGHEKESREMTHCLLPHNFWHAYLIYTIIFSWAYV